MQCENGRAINVRLAKDVLSDRYWFEMEQGKQDWVRLEETISKTEFEARFKLENFIDDLERISLRDQHKYSDYMTFIIYNHERNPKLPPEAQHKKMLKVRLVEYSRSSYCFFYEKKVGNEWVPIECTQSTTKEGARKYIYQYVEYLKERHQKIMTDCPVQTIKYDVFENLDTLRHYYNSLNNWVM